MGYERTVAWKYLYQRESASGIRVGQWASFVMLVVALVWLFAFNRPSPLGVGVAFLAGFSAVIFTLLRLFTVFTTVSILGVVLGVATLVLGLSVSSGFETAFREKILGVNGHVVVTKQTNTFFNYREIEKKVLEGDSRIVGSQPFVLTPMLATKGTGEISGVMLKGVAPEAVGTVLSLPEDMVEGTIESLKVQRDEGTPAQAILGQTLAEKLKAKVGDKITVVTPLSEFDYDTGEPKGSPNTQSFVVGGIFYCGFSEYDKRFMYVSLREAQELVDGADRVLGIEMRVSNVDDAPAVAKRLDQILAEEPGPYKVEDWRELNGPIFDVLTLQKFALIGVLGLIIIVAMVNMISALTMMVTDKTKEISIMKAMGSRRRAMGKTFLYVGVCIALIGTLMGIALGLLTAFLLTKYGYALDPDVYFVDHLPIQVSPMGIVFIAGGAFMVCSLAAIVPAIRASGLAPADGVRHE